MDAPVWFIIIGIIALILYVLYLIFIRGPISNLFLTLAGGQGGCGCLIKTIVGIILGIILIWYIISELI